MARELETDSEQEQETNDSHASGGGGWQPDWDPAMRLHPEAWSADYDLLVNSKPFFLAWAAVCRPSPPPLPELNG
jgi:hypothetical protein